MAKLPHGLLGPFLGSAGPVSGYLRLGTPVVRSKPRSSSYKSTPARQAQQRKLQVVLPFIQAFTGTPFFKKSFPIGKEGSTGYNRALSQVMNGALVGNDSELVLSYPLVLISRGSLPKAENATVGIEQDGHLRFCWTDNSETGKAKASDLVLLVAFAPALGQAVYAVGPNQRSDREALLPVHQFKGYVVETWIGFIDEMETDAADSVYTGRIQL